MARSRSALACIAALLALLVPGSHPAAGPAHPRELWFYQTLSLADSAAFARIEPLWRRAAAAGYSRVVLCDPRFARLSEQGPGYVARIAALRALAAHLRLEIVPGVCLVGRGNGALLAADPNLAEALPVRGALFEVRGGVAHLVPDPPVALPERPGHVDEHASASRGTALTRAGGRVRFDLAVAPWRCYHVAVDVAGEDFRGEARVRASGGGRELAWARVAPPAGAAPERRDVAFNSLGNARVTISFSAGRGARGALRWSRWSVEECGPVNAVHRPGVAFRFEGLAEGRDFDPVTDPLLGASPAPGRFDAWHAPPVVRVRRPDGTRLRGWWWQAAVVERGQAAVCLSDTAVRRRERDEITRVKALFGARTLMLMHDEIRALGWDPPCRAAGARAGAVLAAHVRFCREAAGDAGVAIWGDMFDPFQNARPDYYLARGNVGGAWAGLARDAIVVNWNATAAEQSLHFFAQRGHAQVWAGYYDGPVDGIRALLPALDRVPGVIGVMYTTWQGRYDDLEAFARAARGR